MKISQALEIALTALDHLSNETEDCVGPTDAYKENTEEELLEAWRVLSKLREDIAE
jgi:hypothetical protein